MFLLDTCVLSESSKPQQSARVTEWLATQPDELQFISAVTVGELYYGLARLPEGRKRTTLANWLATIEEDFDGRVVPVDGEVAARWGQIRVGKDMAKTIDLQIAATALTHGFTLVTRNVRDFEIDGLAVFNPWEV